MITWQYEWDGAKIVYNYEPNEGLYFIDEEEHKNIIEYEYNFIMCRKHRKVPIHVDDVKAIADWIENDEENKELIVKMLRDLAKIFDDKEKKADF